MTMRPLLAPSGDDATGLTSSTRQRPLMTGVRSLRWITKRPSVPGATSLAVGITSEFSVANGAKRSTNSSIDPHRVPR